MSIRGDNTCNGVNEAEENLDADASNSHPPIPPINVGDTDDISSTHTISVSFPQQMSTTHGARLLALQCSK